MIIHSTPQYAIYFGDAKDQMYPKKYRHWNDFNLRFRKPIIPVLELLPVQGVFFLRQVHGTIGRVIGQSHLFSLRPFEHEGDFLITSDKKVGIGVMTGDCLPVIAYDRKYHVIGIAHAGWRGAVAGVVPAMIEMIKKNYNTDENDLSLLFGPSAKRCCYEVSPSFVSHLEKYPFVDKVIHSFGKTVFFDLPLFVRLQVQQLGVPPSSFCLEYNACTLCDTSFHSARRARMYASSQEVGRQMTVVALK